MNHRSHQPDEDGSQSLDFQKHILFQYSLQIMRPLLPFTRISTSHNRISCRWNLRIQFCESTQRPTLSPPLASPLWNNTSKLYIDVAKRRCYTTESVRESPKMTKLQRSLKKFYRLVHPDLFAEYPSEKEVNQKSFQMLREFLTHFGDDNKRSHETKEFSVTFYLKNPSDIAGKEKVDSGGRLSLRKGSYVLKTPSSNLTKIWRERHLEHSLSKLYKSCGIDTDLKSSDDAKGDEQDEEGFTDYNLGGVEYTNERRTQENTIVDALLQYSNPARRIIHQRYEEERRVDLAQTIFYIQEKIKVYWQLPGSTSAKLSVVLRLKFELLHRLQQAISSYKKKYPAASNLRNSTIVFSSLRGVDPLGRIILNIEDKPELWADAFERYDPQIQVMKKDGGRSRELLEKEASAKLGIAYFYSDYTLSNSPEYIDFLNRIEAPLYKFEGLQDLKVRVLSVEGLRAEKNSFDIKSCTLNLPITLKPDEIIALIAEKGPEVVEKHRRMIDESNELAELMLTVKRRFRLRGLSQDSEVSNSEFHECLSRLLTYAPRLKSFLDGVKIKVSTKYEMNEDDGTLSIPWDFEI